MAKPATVKIKLVSSADTGFFYVTKKNPRNTTEKMTFRKYDPVVRKHVDFKEAKIKWPGGRRLPARRRRYLRGQAAPRLATNSHRNRLDRRIAAGRTILVAAAHKR